MVTNRPPGSAGDNKRLLSDVVKEHPNRRVPASVSLALAAVATLLAAPGLPAQPPSRLDAATEGPSLQDIQSRVESLQASSDLAEEVRAAALAVYRSALAQVEATDKLRELASQYRAALESGPVELAEARRDLESSRDGEGETAAPDIPTGLPLAELESRLLKARADEAAGASAVQAMEGQLQSERDRPAKIRDRLGELERSARKLEEQLKSDAASDEPGVVRDARRTLLQAELVGARAEMEALNEELLSYEPRAALRSVRMELARRALARAEAARKSIEARVAEVRQLEADHAQRQAALARIEAMGKHPVIAGLADYNAELGATLAEIAANRAALGVELSASKELAEEIGHEFQLARQRVEIAGLSQALGRSLLEVRRNLPDLKRYRREVASRQPTLTEIGLAQLRISERKRTLSAFDRSVAQLLAGDRKAPLSRAELDGVAAQLEALGLPVVDLDQLFTPGVEARDALHRLVRDETQLLDKIDEGYADQLRALVDLDFSQRELLERAQEFAAFLDRRLLWIPSTSVIGLETLRGVGPALGYLFDGENWKAVLSALLAEASSAPAAALLAGIVLVFVVWFRPRAHAALIALGRGNHYPYADGYGVTIRALGITVIIAIVWPFILGFMGWRLQLAAESPDFVNALGYGLSHTAWLLVFFYGFRELCCKGGIAREQFKWRASVVNLLSRNLRWLLVVVVPGVLVVMTLDAQPDRAHVNSLARLTFMLIMVGFGVFLQRVLGPARGVVAKQSEGWPTRLRGLLYPLAVGAPYALAGLAALGYFYSAGALARPLYYTVWLFVGARILSDLVVRWLVVTQRRLEWRGLMEGDGTTRTVRSVSEADKAGESGPAVAKDDEPLDFHTVNDQTRRLLKAVLFVGVIVGLAFIWSDVVPAFTILEDVALWEHAVNLDGKPQLVPVTLLDLGVAVAIGVVIAVAARNFPGLLEVALLRALPLDAGLRYAITSISQYLIVAVGIVVVFNTVGVGWSDVQWLAAALTVGLGFGLQEIFANFVSGIIILFERPVRIGDTVTIGGFTGTVTRIRIRATTITDWDNKEIVVPNKTFITSQLTNWTLSNPIVRVVIRVGVAYGSDPKLAHRVMLETAQANPKVLEHPAPSVYFLSLGESSLDFDVRVYVRNMGDWLPVVHEYHVAIVEALTAHGIQIPFPQRDIHVRSVQSLPVGESMGVNPTEESRVAMAGREGG